jgi:sugar (pentulose or hexulose) kinase
MNKRINTAADRLVIGLDSSTTGTKALALDCRGRVVAQAASPIPLSSPRPNWYEQDPADWWRAACRALSAVARETGPERIAALAISNQRETFVPLTSSGAPLRPAIIWLDERCKSEVDSFAAKIGRKNILAITGKPADYAPVVYRLAWMKRHEAKLFARTDMFCDVHTYLTWKLSGAFKTSWSSADPLGLFDVRKKNWSPVILKALALQAGSLPEALSPGTVLGEVTKKAAKATGLKAGTLVVAGGGDGQAAGLGVNALSSARAYLNLGTAVVAGVFSAECRTLTAFRTLTACADSGYYFECSLRAGTFAVDWLVKTVLGLDPQTDPDVYPALEAGARKIAPGSDGVFHLPYLSGVMNPYWDMNARGAFTGLSGAHGRFHLYRAVLEGIAFEQALALEAVERSMGESVRELAAIGGGTSNALWLSILADVTGKAICLPANTEASALGAGIAAAVGAGWFDGFREAASAMTSIRSVIKPDAKNRKVYRALFEEYKTIYPRLKSGKK